MYRASNHVQYDEWTTRVETAAAELDLTEDVVATATDLFLSEVPDDDRSKPAVLAACLYAGALIEGESRSQAAIADTVGVSRLSVQKRWKPLVTAAGFQPPEW
ncbi:MAG: transcription initiation factor TFIIIB, Brf1 subunit/Transcription initiation factor TFIIB [uncultured archaeon A07HR60]|jgi:Transcription initiation factor TFIIIB, Brf1 subunit/Transcription initiation factor TFIIB|nr:MAG: transcription initiation factor TFIIIB, Brf1 subunit/Transcription initiation factor TFIIB [uncultured archaeon A07HR60]